LAIIGISHEIAIASPKGITPGHKTVDCYETVDTATANVAGIRRAAAVRRGRLAATEHRIHSA
jgi:hypothetical protein